MRSDAPSRTGQWVAAARGLGRLLPDGVQIADDPYGLAFTAPRVARLVDLARGARPRAAAAIATAPGVAAWVAYMQVRTRLIDDAARAFVARGGRQLVLLGAGFDCRALRLPELAGAQIFEVDHPATQAHKRRVLERRNAASPARYLAWDFEARPPAELPGALADAGHDAAAPTLTIWEGVTMYLSEAAIDASLRAIAAWSAPGSELALTYMVNSRLAAPTPWVRAVRALVQRIGEPFVFGWDPGALAGQLADHGFTLTGDELPGDAARRLLPPALAARVVHADRVAFARAG